jgi:hypothetical protein
MADPGMGDLDQHFALARRCDINVDNLERFSGLEGHSGTGFHPKSPQMTRPDLTRVQFCR